MYFRQIDDDSSKTLTIAEFTKGLYDHNIIFTKDESAELFRLFDKNQSGTLDFDEFLNAVRVRGFLKIKIKILILIFLNAKLAASFKLSDESNLQGVRKARQDQRRPSKTPKFSLFWVKKTSKIKLFVTIAFVFCR